METAGNQEGARTVLDSSIVIVEISRIFWNYANYNMSSDPMVWLLMLLVVIDNDYTYETFIIVNLLTSFLKQSYQYTG